MGRRTEVWREEPFLSSSAAVHFSFFLRVSVTRTCRVVVGVHVFIRTPHTRDHLKRVPPKKKPLKCFEVVAGNVAGKTQASDEDLVATQTDEVVRATFVRRMPEESSWDAAQPCDTTGQLCGPTGTVVYDEETEYSHFSRETARG